LCRFDGVQAEASLRNLQTVAAQSHKKRAATYTKVFHGRKRAIRGLWRRNSRFYARIPVEAPNNGMKQVRRVPLEVETLAQAQARIAAAGHEARGQLIADSQAHAEDG
jgi:hypothetical protein